MMLGLTFLSIKIVSLHREEYDCSSELLRDNASIAGIEIESIPAFQYKCYNVALSYCKLGLSHSYFTKLFNPYCTNVMNS